MLKSLVKHKDEKIESLESEAKKQNDELNAIVHMFEAINSKLLLDYSRLRFH